MSHAGFTRPFLEAIRTFTVNPSQGVLLQTIVQAIDPDTVLSNHASQLHGVVLTVASARDAMISAGATGQPHARLLTQLCMSALSACATALKHCPSATDLRAAHSAIHAITSRNMAKKYTTADRTALTQSGQVVSQHFSGVQEEVRAMFKEAWSEPWAERREFVRFAASEMACLVAMTERDPVELSQRLASELKRCGPDVERIVEVLLPSPRHFRFACAVSGADQFAYLSAFSSGAEHLTGPAASSAHGFGAAGERLRAWLADVARPGDGTVLSVRVQAVDRASAARRGRRELHEILDQYMAGRRLLRLTLHDPGIVCEEFGSRTALDTPPTHSIPKALPLVDYWPIGLRESLRTAHLARTTTAPMTSAALSWSSLEAAGLSDRPTIASSLALQSMRQQIADLYRGVRADLAGHVANARVDGLERARFLRGRAGVRDGLPAGHRAVSRLNGEIAQAKVDLRRLALWIEELAAAQDSMKTLETHLPLNEFAYLRDVNDWLDVLLPSRPGEAASLTDARTALDRLGLVLSPLTRSGIEGWQRRLHNPAELAAWLEQRKAAIESLLHMMYAARNLAFHSGMFASDGDVVMSRGAVLISDMVLEFLGNYYRHIHQATKAPIEIVQELALRYQKIIRELLNSRGPAHPLNIGRLTGPATTGWDR